MFSVAVVGHSLTPSQISVAGVNVQVYRKPGCKWDSLDQEFFNEFWGNTFDLVIFILGGNDLVSSTVSDVISHAKHYIQRSSTNCRNIRVFTVEKRHYVPGNRFGEVPSEYRRKLHGYNRRLRREIRRLGPRFGVVSVNHPWLVNERTSDGVHYNVQALSSFCRMLGRVIRGVMGANV